MKKIIITIIAVLVFMAILTVGVFAEGAEAVEETKKDTIVWTWLSGNSGRNLALLGAFLAVFFCGWGSAKGVGLAGRTAAGVVAQNPQLSGKMIVLEALPATQGIYGFIVSFLVLIKIGLFDNFSTTISTVDGLYYLIACLPIAFVGFFSAVHQAKVASAGMQMIAKQNDKNGMAITYSAMVETYAILALVISAFLVLFYKLPTA